MSGLGSYLASLITSSPVGDGSDGEKRLLEEWGTWVVYPKIKVQTWWESTTWSHRNNKSICVPSFCHLRKPSNGSILQHMAMHSVRSCCPKANFPNQTQQIPSRGIPMSPIIPMSLGFLSLISTAQITFYLTLLWLNFSCAFDESIAIVDWHLPELSFRKPNVEPLLDSLLAITSSSKPNETISEEVAEIIGYDDIELTMEILDNRTAITQEVRPCNFFSCLPNLIVTSLKLLLCLGAMDRIRHGMTKAAV
jgi:hypothetical protein